jgi:ABC-type thiamine transport system ATPase subunit
LSQLFLRGGRGGDRFEVALSAGAHAVVGVRDPHSTELIGVLAGLAAPRWLQVRVDGRSPRSAPDVRRRIGTLFPDEETGEGASVGAMLFPLLRLRGVALGPTELLSAFGLAGWVDRPPRSLSSLERRAIALSVALSLPDPVVLALHEPFAAGLDRGHVVASILQHSARGAIIIAGLADVADAALLGGQCFGLSRGAFYRVDPLPGPDAGVRFLVETEDVRTLGSALASEPDVARVSWVDTGSVGQVTVEGDEASRVALAVLRAAHRAGSPVRSMVRDRGPTPPRGETS